MPSRTGEEAVERSTGTQFSRFDRRTFLASAGAVGVAGLTGCLGNGDSSDSGNGTTAGDSNGSRTTIKLAHPPFGPTQLLFDTISDQGWLTEMMDEAGYEIDRQVTWEDPSLFAAGQTDMGVVGPYGAGLMGNEQGTNTVFVGNLLRTDTNWYTYTGSGYEISETGSVEASLEALAQDNAQVAIGGWGGGDVPLVQLIFEAFYGHNFNSEQADFQITTIDYASLSQALVEQRTQSSYGAPTYGSIPYFLNEDGMAMEEPELEPIFIVANQVLDQGYTVPALEGLAVREEVYNEHPEAAVAYHDAVEQGLEYLHNNLDELKQDQDLMETLGIANTMPQHEFWVDWTLSGDISDYGLPDRWSLDVQPLLETPYQQDQIDSQAETLDTLASETSLVPDNWSEFVTYEDV